MDHVALQIPYTVPLFQSHGNTEITNTRVSILVFFSKMKRDSSEESKGLGSRGKV